MGRRTVAAETGEVGWSESLDFLLQSNPSLQRAITVTHDDDTSALQRLANGSIDGFFAMDTLDGDLIRRLRPRTDPQGKRLYRFIDIRPGAGVFRGSATVRDAACIAD